TMRLPFEEGVRPPSAARTPASINSSWNVLSASSAAGSILAPFSVPSVAVPITITRIASLLAGVGHPAFAETTNGAFANRHDPAHLQRRAEAGQPPVVGP